MKYIAILIFSGIVVLMIIPGMLAVAIIVWQDLREWRCRRYMVSHEKHGTIAHRKSRRLYGKSRKNGV